MNPIKIGNLISKKRKEKNYTQKDLADKLGVTDRAISKWERGVGCPDISYLEDLSKLLNISGVELLRGEENAEVNEQSIIESIKNSNEITKVQIRKTISTILMTIIILISGLIIISNIKIIRSITRKYYYDFSYLESKKEELNNYYKIIINNQGIYSDDDYDKIKEFVNNTKKKIDSFNYKNGYYTLSEFYKIYDNYMNIFMESNLKIDAPYDILLKYDLDIYQHLHTYYVANNILNNHFSKFEEYLIGLYRYSYRNFSEVFSHPNANYMLAKELMIFEDIIEVGELDD